MTIEINSLGDVLGVILAGVTVLGIGSAIHWKVFAAPLLQRLLAPMADGLAVHSRILREKYPEDYSRVEAQVRAERELRGAV